MLREAVGLVADVLKQPQRRGVPAQAQRLGVARPVDFLFAFRQAGAQPVARLQGLVAGHQYSLTNVRDGSVLGAFSAEALAAGALDLSALGASSAVVLAVAAE